MQRHVVLALAVGALSIAPALADPMPLHPDIYTNSTRRPVPSRATVPQPASEPVDAERAPAVRYASAEREVNLGGGFIEFLFGGGRAVAPPRPQAEVAMPRYAALPARPEDTRPEPDPKFLKQTVTYTGTEKPGTIVIDTLQRFLFLVQDDGTAVRYGIGVGKPGFTWAGVKAITAKKEWPDWVPPPEMLQRRPDLPSWMAGGPENPLGARALYLGSSLYRIHGSNEPWTIGQAVSSGCIRMRNEDVTDLYTRVKVGTKVVVI
jgi:lipoprotein-anchoring transpeptidase ErfK/SrfK